MYVYAACPCQCCMSIFTPHFHVFVVWPCKWCMRMFPCCMSMLIAHATCPCCLYMLQVHVACTCCRSMLFVHAACSCFMSMLLAHAACPCGMSLSLCCISMMHVHAACTCCLSMAPRLKQREFTSLFSPPILVDTPNPYCSVSRWRPQKVDKCMVLEYTHGLFIT
jgi:hypothetical protein